ncbi:hypothetical protein D3C71_1806570 [compost metagenome]
MPTTVAIGRFRRTSGLSKASYSVSLVLCSTWSPADIIKLKPGKLPTAWLSVLVQPYVSFVTEPEAPICGSPTNISE